MKVVTNKTFAARAETTIEDLTALGGFALEQAITGGTVIGGGYRAGYGIGRILCLMAMSSFVTVLALAIIDL